MDNRYLNSEISGQSVSSEPLVWTDGVWKRGLCGQMLSDEGGVWVDSYKFGKRPIEFFRTFTRNQKMRFVLYAEMHERTRSARRPDGSLLEAYGFDDIARISSSL